MFSRVMPSTVFPTSISSTTCCLNMCLMACTVYSASLSVSGCALPLCCSGPSWSPGMSSPSTRASSALAVDFCSASACAASAAVGAFWAPSAPGFFFSTCDDACCFWVALYTSSVGRAAKLKGAPLLSELMWSMRPSNMASTEKGISAVISSWKPGLVVPFSPPSRHCRSTPEYRLIRSRTSSSLSFSPNSSNSWMSPRRLGHFMAILVSVSTAAARTTAFSRIRRL
mmetsp:Transcript_127345/g.360331  ORF Transcript_127345/g.360331 Transcript_127345/m.360331 type:complete len:227 (-) Transcript_127345:104-784(-)